MRGDAGRDEEVRGGANRDHNCVGSVLGNGVDTFQYNFRLTRILFTARRKRTESVSRCALFVYAKYDGFELNAI